nr:retrovirus-related Pol polyprotein from transposon TNT 1-94 [Tanacetum cinerariifolium]GEX63025.1 retrovirus-related Pol polyprotein from transposon TNT 1-94 [Tanacetum cinerariifolium]
EDDPSRKYQANYDISYYIIPQGRSLTELTQDSHVPEVFTLNEQNTPQTKDVEGHPDLINTEGTQVQEVQDEQVNQQPTKEILGSNTETSVSIIEPLVPEPPAFESSKFPDYVYKLDKALYGLKQAPKVWFLKGTPSLGLWYLKCSGFDLKGYSDSKYAGCNIVKKSTSVTPLPCSETKKKTKSQNVSQAKPKTQGPKASGALPQKRKPPKTQKTPVVQPTETPPTEKVPTKNSGKTTDPKDSEGNKHPADMGLPSMVPYEGNGKTKPLFKGPCKDKDSERLKPLADMESQIAPITVLSGTNAEYQVDQTQFNRFEVSVYGQHQSKTSSKVELDFEPLKLTIIANIQALLGAYNDELKEDSDEDVFKAGEEIDEYILEPDTKETQNHHSTKNPNEEEHQSPPPTKDQLESFHAKKTDVSNSESSSCSETFKLYENYMPITERQLVRNLNNFLEVIYAHVAKDTWKKHEEATASYADLKWGLEDFINTSFTKILDNLKEVQDVLKEDHALNKKVLEAIEAYTKNPPILLSSSPWSNNYEGGGLSHNGTKETPSHTKGEKDDMVTEEVVKKVPTKEPKVANEEELVQQPQHTSPIPITIVRPITRPNPELEMIGSSSRLYHLTNDEIQDHLDKEKKMKKDIEEAKLLAMSKPDLIKVIHEEASKARIDPKILESAKGGQEFKKIQDAELKIPNKKHAKKIKSPKNKNKAVKDLMNSLSKRYEILRTIFDELSIGSNLSTPGQVLSITLERKRKHQELEPEIRIHGLECNRSLSEGFPFVNNMVIEDPEYGMLFVDIFGDEAF